MIKNFFDMLGRLFYLSMGLCVGYQSGLIFALAPMTTPEYTDYMSRAQSNFKKAKVTLENCLYFERVHLAAWVNLREMSTVKIKHMATDFDRLCAVANPFDNEILLYPNIWKHHNPRCYQGKEEIVIAHEVLHLVGLPMHHRYLYKTHEEFIAKDAIEKTIRACYPELDR